MKISRTRGFRKKIAFSTGSITFDLEEDFIIKFQTPL